MKCNAAGGNCCFHYKGQNVSLQDKHIETLEVFFKQMNHSGEYKNYPILLYHGYYQRRVGCFASRSVYIDSAGDVHSCPFCHTKSYNIIDLIRRDSVSIPGNENSCPRFNNVVN